MDEALSQNGRTTNGDAARSAAPAGGIDRRTVLASGLVGGLFAAAGAAPAASAASLLVPGYRPDRAWLDGRPLLAHAPLRRAIAPDYAGPIALLTRIGPDGGTRRVLLPIAIHALAVAPDRLRAFVCSLEGESFLLLDTTALEVDAVLAPHEPGFVGGGHAVWSPDGAVVYVTERRRPAPYSGDPAAHEGRVVVRDGRDGRVLAVWPSGGIGPHDIALLPDGATLAVAHYGSPDSGRGPAGPKAPGVVEPSIAFLDRTSGRVLERVLGPERGLEIRHLTPVGARAVVAIQTRLVEGDEALAPGPRGEIVEADDTAAPGLVFAPAPLLAVERGATPRARPCPMPEPADFRQGQSLVYDPKHGEVIATFPSAQAIVVADARNGTIRKVVRTTVFGLSRPRGVGLLPDGRHYVVSGNWRGILCLRRGEHRPVLERSRLDVPLFGHSHLTVV